tara:strand:+ start:8930 stop:9346 length:417 start_codon:yes stop_codon:yes gene_type:complete
MEIKTLNNNHKKIINDFIIDVEGFIYRITEDANFNKFNNFKPVLSNAIELHNNIGNELNAMDIDESEWIYMFPNYLLFAGIGFAASSKNKENETQVNAETEFLFDTTHKTITKLENMIAQYDFIMEKTKQTKTQTKND